jgi:hypothetical protein
MSLSHNRIALLVSATLLGTSACDGNGTVPAQLAGSGNSPLQVSAATTDAAPLTDNTSILKKLKKNVVIGSTVDPANGDMGSRGVAVVALNNKLKKGQLLVCNFADSSGAAGEGTTIEVLDPSPGSKPTTFAQNSKIEGCDDDSVSPASGGVYAGGFLSGLVAQFSPSGKLTKTWGKPLEVPFSVIDGACTGPVSQCGYSAEYVYASDAQTGGIVSFSVNIYGNPKPTEVASGFAVNKTTGWSALGPSGLAFNSNKGGTLYIADGVDNTVVSFFNATELLVTDEIVVQKGGKTFKCKYPKTTCGKLIFSGSPLNAPVAMARLPNGNLIVANTGGSAPNTLVELTTEGKVLATKVVDKSTTAGIFGLAATGTNDSNTALFFTDANDNNLHKLER